MAESFRDSALPRALSDVVGDLADLIQKELRLARAELTDKLSLKLRAGVWMSVAAFLGVCVVLLALQAAVFAIASFGIAMHWSCLIVAAAVAVIAGAIFAKAKADAGEELTPERTIRQVTRDIAIAKEQLS